MEKLRLALEKAREQRGEGQLVTDTRRRMPTPAATAANLLWEDLLGFEPNRKQLEKQRIVTHQAASEARHFDMLSTKTLLHMRKTNWRRLAITSATADCGKTLVAVNIALSLLRQPDVRAILFELDLHRPSLARLLGTTPQHSIADVLAGNVPFEQQAVRIGSSLAVSVATGPLADPGQLLLSNFTTDVLQDIEARYRPDLMIFDMPPSMAGAYVATFLGNVDCALTVARAKTSTISQIDNCEREIAEYANVLGIVLNQCDFAEDPPTSSRYYGS